MQSSAFERSSTVLETRFNPNFNPCSNILTGTSATLSALCFGLSFYYTIPFQVIYTVAALSGVTSLGSIYFRSQVKQRYLSQGNVNAINSSINNSDPDASPYPHAKSLSKDIEKGSIEIVESTQELAKCEKDPDYVFSTWKVIQQVGLIAVTAFVGYIAFMDKDANDIPANVNRATFWAASANVTYQFFIEMMKTCLAINVYGCPTGYRREDCCPAGEADDHRYAAAPATLR